MSVCFRNSLFVCRVNYCTTPDLVMYTIHSSHKVIVNSRLCQHDLYVTLWPLVACVMYTIHSSHKVIVNSRLCQHDLYVTLWPLVACVLQLQLEAVFRPSVYVWVVYMKYKKQFSFKHSIV